MDFQYNPLHFGRPAFRLVKLKAGYGKEAIRCELIDAFFDDATTVLDYEAVSYTWGDATNTRNIALNGRFFSVGNNLWSLLHDIRYANEDRILWIDAISINQDCHGERGHQVQQMDQIYRHAFRVIIWLGTPTTKTDLCMDAMRECQKYIPELDWSPTHEMWQQRWTFFQPFRSFNCADHQHTLSSILARPWFRRVWIIQEVANARAAIIYCGSRHVLARTFVLCASLPRVDLPKHCKAILDIMPGPNRRSSWWGQNPDFYTILSRFSKAEATRDHDKIYALLGLCPPAAGEILVDYTKPIGSVIRDAISFVCGFDTSRLVLKGFSSAREFAENLAILHQTVLVAMMTTSHIHYAEQFLRENKSRCRMTPRLLTAVESFEVSGEAPKSHNYFDLEPWISYLPVVGRSAKGRFLEDSQLKPSGRALHDTEKSGTAQRILRQQDMLVKVSGAGAETAVRILLGIGTEPNWRSGNNQTPLHAAASQGHLAVVQLLLDSGARCDIRDLEEQTPLDRALSCRKFEVAQLLLERGAN